MSARFLKFCALAVVTSICGFAVAPVFAQDAASVIQASDQNIVQDGSSNVAVQGNEQTAVENQAEDEFSPSVKCFAAPCKNRRRRGVTIIQINRQSINQFGAGNTAIQNDSVTAVSQDTKYFTRKDK